MVIETRSPEETFAVGKSLGEKAFPGQVLTLIGDLGVGKTVFTQGLAEGLGIEEPVNSPTFTIVQVYEEGRLPFYHFDVYRIGDIEEMDEVGFEEYVMGEGVSLIEWANLIEEILPGEGIRYTATVYAGSKLKDGEVTFRVAVSDENGVICDSQEFTLPTQRAD